MKDVNCRFCGTKLEYTLVNLGLSPLSNEYRSQDEIAEGQYYYPLIVHVCGECFLAQAMEFSKPDTIFTNYKYFSSYSKSWLKHCREYVDMIVPYIKLNSKSCVTEIACNDGYLLQYFKPYNIPAYGIEPSENVALEAKKQGIDVEVSFFGKSLAEKLVSQRGKSNLIIGNNVFAHVPDINGFVEGLRILLDKEGLITLEFPHLLKLMQNNQFDTIYHEHYYYFSLLSLVKVFSTHGLKIVKVDELDTHGGSVRIYITHDSDCRENDESVEKVLNDEYAYKLNSNNTYESFSKSVRNIKLSSIKLLTELKNKGKSIAAYGAAAKGNTFLNYCGLGSDIIDYVSDANPHKQGSYLPGSQIPIVDKSKIYDTKPDYIVILPWNISDEIEDDLREVRRWDCKFITFIPETKVW